MYGNDLLITLHTLSATTNVVDQREWWKADGKKFQRSIAIAGLTRFDRRRERMMYCRDGDGGRLRHTCLGGKT